MEDVVYTDHADGIATVFLNRPARLNALDLDAAVQLKRRLQRLAHDDGVVALVVAGRGRAFCAGGDLAWAAGFPDGIRTAFHLLAGEFHQAILEIRETGKPVVAGIEGVAAGGGFALALACDFRVMGRDATLRQGYTSAGLSPDGGSTFMLPRLVGSARALEIATFDEPIPAARAAALGLATRVVDRDAVAEAIALARAVSERSLESFARSKRLLNESYERPLAAQLAAEREAIVACAASPEGREGVNAFVTKRRPDFGRARTPRRPPE